MSAFHVAAEATDGGTGLKPFGRWAISLCSAHHREQHNVGEAECQRRYGVNLYEMAVKLAKTSPHSQTVSLEAVKDFNK